MVEVVGTRCCALGHLVAGNWAEERSLREVINGARVNEDGVTSLFCVVNCSETKLEVKIKKLGFKLLTTFKRRVPLQITGSKTLKLYFKKLR